MSNLTKIISVLFLSPIFLLLLVCLFFLPTFGTDFSIPTYSEESEQQEIVLQNDGFLWPTPGYMTITSPFGNRSAPTSGASSFHTGIDIAVPTGSNIVASLGGTVIYTGFNGANGFTIRIQSGNFIISYSHISPDFIVSVGDVVQQGQVITKGGPLYVYGVPNNPYRDKNGNPTNGATTGPHLHFKIEKDGIAVNPIDYL